MEFLLGFLVGGGCALFLLLLWGRHQTGVSSAHPNAPPTDHKHQSYEGVIADLEAESDLFLRELQEAFSTYPSKRR